MVKLFVWRKQAPFLTTPNARKADLKPDLANPNPIRKPAEKAVLVQKPRTNLMLCLPECREDFKSTQTTAGEKPELGAEMF
jgi:hypothetical protein